MSLQDTRLWIIKYIVCGSCLSWHNLDPTIAIDVAPNAVVETSYLHKLLDILQNSPHESIRTHAKNSTMIRNTLFDYSKKEVFEEIVNIIISPTKSDGIWIKLLLKKYQEHLTSYKKSEFIKTTFAGLIAVNF